MGKVADNGKYFLKTVGRRLGYDENNMPDMDDFDVITTFHIPIWEYRGMTEEEYYGDEVTE